MAGFKPKKKDVFIEFYKSNKFKEHKELTKPRSPLTILFCTCDLPDEWLIDIVEYKTKTGLVTDTYMILDTQVKRFTKLYEENGFQEKNNKN